MGSSGETYVYSSGFKSFMPTEYLEKQLHLIKCQYFYLVISKTNSWKLCSCVYGSDLLNPCNSYVEPKVFAKHSLKTVGL